MPNETLPTIEAARFAIRALSVLQYANGFTLWHYKAPRIGELVQPNYFGEASDMMAKGDHMHVSAPDGNALIAIVAVDAGMVEIRILCA